MSFLYGADEVLVAHGAELVALTSLKVNMRSLIQRYPDTEKQLEAIIVEMDRSIAGEFFSVEREIYDNAGVVILCLYFYRQTDISCDYKLTLYRRHKSMTNRLRDSCHQHSDRLVSWWST